MLSCDNQHSSQVVLISAEGSHCLCFLQQCKDRPSCDDGTTQSRKAVFEQSLARTSVRRSRPLHTETQEYLALSVNGAGYTITRNTSVMASTLGEACAAFFWAAPPEQTTK